MAHLKRSPIDATECPDVRGEGPRQLPPVRGPEILGARPVPMPDRQHTAVHRRGFFLRS